MRSAINLASKQEAFYAEVDELQLDPPSVPLPMDVQEQDPILPESIHSDEFINVQKCTNCAFESKIPGILKQHLNSIVQCSKCPQIFCGKRAKRQHISHEKKHEVKPPKKVKEHILA